MFDAYVADDGRTYAAVFMKRRFLQIRRFRLEIQDSGGSGKNREYGLLGTLPDLLVANIIGRSVGAIMIKRHAMGIPVCRFFCAWQPAELELMGQIPDKEIARLYGRREAAVRQRRHILKIPNKAGYYRPWTKAEDKLLGTVPIAQLARRLGRTRGAVRTRRQESALRQAPSGLSSLDSRGRKAPGQASGQGSGRPLEPERLCR